MNYKIKKGEHSSSPIFPILSLNKKNAISWTIKFDRTAVYDLGNDNQLDINKLCGIGWFPNHHKNSARFGWRSAGNEEIELFGYCYDKGVRSYATIGRIQIGKQYLIELSITDNSYQFFTDVGFVKIPKTFNQPWIGYWLKPYFGGDETAPHDILINLNRIK